MTVSAAAAALLLRPPPPDAGALRLVAVASPLGRDGWLGREELDGELVYCLADLLQLHARQDGEWGAELAALVTDRPEAADALAELAAELEQRSQWGAAAWCRDRREELLRRAGDHPGDRRGWEAGWLADWPEVAAG